MSLYELLLFLHVLAAAAWFGAALLTLALVELAVRGDDTPGVVWLGKYDDPLAKWLFIPAAVTVLGSGVGLVLDGPWSLTDDGWLLAGLLLFAATFVFGIGVIVPAGNRLKNAAAAGGGSADLAPLIGRLRTLSWIDVAALALVIFLMTVKPL